MRVPARQAVDGGQMVGVEAMLEAEDEDQKDERTPVLGQYGHGGFPAEVMVMAMNEMRASFIRRSGVGLRGLAGLIWPGRSTAAAHGPAPDRP